MLINPNYPPHAADAVEVQSAAQSIGRQLLVLRAASPQAIDLAFATLVAQRAGALLVGGDPFLVGRSQQIATLATRHAIPAIYDFRESVLAGGLMSYGVNLANNYRQLGVYAGRILKGESAADLPVMQPTIFDFVINLETAKALGLDSAADAARPRRRGDRMNCGRGRYGDETSPPTISASGSGRCRAPGRVALRLGASLSDAAGAHHRRLCRRRRRPTSSRA